MERLARSQLVGSAAARGSAPARVRPQTCPPRHPACRSGADPGLRNDDNESPAELAEASGLDEIANLLNQRQQLKRLMSSNSRRRMSPSLGSAGSRKSPMGEGERPRGGASRGGEMACGGCAAVQAQGSWARSSAPGAWHCRACQDGGRRMVSFGSCSPAEVPPDEACIICLERPKVVILAPCGHRCTCKRCTRTILLGSRDKRSCPLCKERIESFVAKVFE